MKRFVKWIQIFVIALLLGQYFSVPVIAVEALVQEKQSIKKELYSYYSKITDEMDQRTLNQLMEDYEHPNYQIQKPMKLLNIDEEVILENAYYPVLVENELSDLIKFNSRTKEYNLENEEVVESFKKFNHSKDTKESILFIEYKTQIIGKAEKTNFNFSSDSEISNEIDENIEKLSLKNDSKSSYNIFDTKESLTNYSNNEIEIDSSEILKPKDTNNQESISSEEDQTNSQVDKEELSTESTKESNTTESSAIDDLITSEDIDKLEAENKSNEANREARSNDNEWGNGQYVTTDMKANLVSRSNQHFFQNNYYFLVRSPNGKYSYTRSLIMNNYFRNQPLDHQVFKKIGGDTGNIKQSSYDLSYYKYGFKSGFYQYYNVLKDKNPCEGKSLNYYLNWLFYWSDANIKIVKQDSQLDMDNYVRKLNTGIEYRPANKKYVTDDIKANLMTNKTDFFLKNNYYFLVKSPNGKYSYTNSLKMNTYFSKRGLDHHGFFKLGGDTGNIKQSSYSPNCNQYGFKADFYKFYDVTNDSNPCAGKDLDYYLNWLFFWSDANIKIIKQDSQTDMDNYVRKLNTGIEYRPANKKYVTDDIKANLTASSNAFTLRNKYYFLIQAPNGKYSYARSLQMNNFFTKQTLDHHTFSRLGGDTGNIRKSTFGSVYYQYNFRSDFFKFYDVTKDVNPCIGKGLDYYLNWLFFWSDANIKIVKQDSQTDLDNYVRKLNTGIEYRPANKKYVTDDIKANLSINEKGFTLRNKYYFLIQAPNGKYSYTRSLQMNNFFTNQTLDHHTFSRLGGDTGNIRKSTFGSVYYQYNFRSDFFKFYDVTKDINPCIGKGLDYYLNWLFFWSDANIQIVEEETQTDMDNYVRKLNTGIEYKPANKKYVTDDIKANLSVNEKGFTLINNYYFLVQAPNGRYSYTNSLKMNNHFQKQTLDHHGFYKLGGDTGNIRESSYGTNCYQYNFQSDFFKFYDVTKDSNPCVGKGLDYYLNWLFFWSDANIKMVKQDSQTDMDNYVRKLNTGIEYRPANKKYVTDEIKANLTTTVNDFTLKNNYYFLIQSPNGRYSYTRSIKMNNYFTKQTLDHHGFSKLGGDTGNIREALYGNTYYQYNFQSDFFKFYDVTKDNNPCVGKGLDYYLNWLFFWSDANIQIVKQNSQLDMDNHVRTLNTGIEYNPEHNKYVTDEIKANLTTTGNDFTLKNNYYFLIKAPNGKISYTKSLKTNNYFPKQGLDHHGFSKLGGDPGNLRKSDYDSAYYQYGFYSEFYTFYDVNKDKNPCIGQGLDYYLNWLDFWTNSEISIVEEKEIDLYVAKKNNAIRDWRFFSEGHTTSKDQHYSLSLRETTRLNIDIDNSARLRVYNKENQKLFDVNYSKKDTSDKLDLPAGDYYISVTGINSETTFQMVRGTFDNSRLHVNSSEERTDVFVDGEYSKQLTDLYQPHHRKNGENTSVLVNNTLVGIWNNSPISYNELDELYGRNHLFKQPVLSHPGVTNLGPISLVDNARSNTMQYIGQEHFHSNKKIFSLEDGPQQRVVGIDDALIWMGIIYVVTATAAVYSANVPDTSNLTLTMPKVRGYEYGSWVEDDLNEKMKDPRYQNPDLNLDCSEIAEELAEIDPRGIYYWIEAEDKEQFNVWEYGKVRGGMYYHVVYSRDGLIYDPRYSVKPVKKNIYFKETQSINSKKLNVYERPI